MRISRGGGALEIFRCTKKGGKILKKNAKFLKEKVHF